MFDVKRFDVVKFDAILAKGLSHGLGRRDDKVCIEAAICQVLDLPHGDDPGCVAESVRSYKIRLNDSRWSSPEARAKGLRDLGLAQLGSKGVVSDAEFTKRLAEKTIRVLIPKLFREVFPNDASCLEAAKRCEDEGTEAAVASAVASGWVASARAAAVAARAAAAAAAAEAAEWEAAARGAAEAAGGAAAAAAAEAAEASGWVAAEAARAAARA